MLQLNYIRDNRDTVIERLAVKNFKDLDWVDDIIALDEKRRKVQSESDAVAAEANSSAKQIGDLMRQGKKEEAEAVKSKSAGYKEQIRLLQEELETVEQELNDKLIQLPNLPHTSVPRGTAAEDNEVAFEHGTIPTLPEDALPHWELAAKYGIIDFELGTKITGAGFPVYKGKGARLQRALINFFLDEAEKAGFKEVQV